MILYQPLHGTLEDGTEPEAFEAGSILEFIPEIPGDAADAGHGNLTVAVRSDMAGEEGTEIVDDQTPHGGYVHLAVDEVGQGTEETVGQRLAVDTVDDDRGHAGSACPARLRSPRRRVCSPEPACCVRPAPRHKGKN